MKENNIYNKNLITIEQVGAGHPDKVADLISEIVSDEFIKKDYCMKTAIETMIGYGNITIMGEVGESSWFNIEKEIEEAKQRIEIVIKNRLEEFNEGYENFLIHWNLVGQSAEINQQVVKDDGEVGAGDQGIMVGVATNFNAALLPIEVNTINILNERVKKFLKHQGISPLLKQDYKIQVTLGLPESYDTKLKFRAKIHRLHLAIQVKRTLNKDDDDFLSHIKDILSEEIEGIKTIDRNNISIITFVQGGANADVGLTGRKLVCDAYGPRFPIGGGATHGKDLTKVDRSGKIYAKWIAKGIINRFYPYDSGHYLPNKDTIKRVEIVVQIAYIIGETNPIHITVFKNGKIINNKSIALLKFLDESSSSLRQVIERITERLY